MEWYYAIEKQQHGPVSEARLAELLRSGVITGSTLVWRKGMTDWLPYEKVASAAGTAFEPGLAPPLPGGQELPSPEAWARQIKEAPSEINVGECFGKGWEMFQRNMPTTIGVMVLFFLINFALGMVPFLGFFASILLTGPLFGGLFYYFLLMVRGRECLVGNAFAGFGTQFVPLMLTGLLVSLISFLTVLPIVAVIIFLIISIGVTSQSPAQIQETLEALSVGMIVLFIGLTMLFALLIAVVTAMLQFAYPLILDKGVDLMSAVRLSLYKCSRKLLPLLVMLILGWLLMFAGTLLCLVGLLFTMPWFIAALAVAYDQLFPGATYHSQRR